MDNFKSNHDRYVESLEYKMVFILSGYRNILLMLGTDFLKNLQEYRAANDREPFLQANSMTLIDAGYEELNLDEVRLYSNYIAKIMNYDENEFFECLKDKAYKFDYNDDDYVRMMKYLFNIMYSIDKNMM